MILKLWDLSGHASDLYPFQADEQLEDQIELGSEGTTYFLRLLSEGQVALANWKKADRRFLRFRNFYISKNIQLGVDKDIKFTVLRNSKDEFEVDPTQLNWELSIESFENAIFMFGGTGYKIMSVTELDPARWLFNVYPDIGEEPVPAYPETIVDSQFAISEFPVSNLGVSTNSTVIDLPERVYSILRIDDYMSDTEIRQASSKDELAISLSNGVPQEYVNYGSKIIFDTALLEKRWFRFELFQQPEDIVDLDQVLSIPGPFHQALVFWCLWQIAVRERQEIHSMNYRRLLENELISTRDEYDNDFEKSRTNGFKVRRS